jgi:hypothetical protein
VRDPSNCPTWCVADHAVEDESRARHRSEIIDVPVVAPDRAIDLMVELYRYGAEPTTWVYIGDGTDQRLELSRESVARLAAVLRSSEE